MKKLNNRGYMLIEIIIASVIAFSIAYYLINLTYKFKDQNLNLYTQTELESDKINITRNIMDDLGLLDETGTSNISDYDFENICTSITNQVACIKSTDVSGNKYIRKITIEGTKKLTYSAYTSPTSEEIIYTKTLKNGNEFTEMTTNNNTITIGITNIYSHETEYIKIVWGTFATILPLES